MLKAIALGATAAGIGRPAIWGLAAAGREGVEKVLQTLWDELCNAMALCGCAKVSDITFDLVAQSSIAAAGRSDRTSGQLRRPHDRPALEGLRSLPLLLSPRVNRRNETRDPLATWSHIEQSDISGLTALLGC